ncbi:hypothetical protein [Metamycoplasma equirhinis]|uniref:hypothetical protein n=1 Tax=Metamycoplasma equirhinis TaxID=92402 RepID=UPI003593016D
MNSNKKKTAIIVGSVATALLASAAIATALYLKGKNKLINLKIKQRLSILVFQKKIKKNLVHMMLKLKKNLKR